MTSYCLFKSVLEIFGVCSDRTVVGNLLTLGTGGGRSQGIKGDEWRREEGRTGWEKRSDEREKQSDKREKRKTGLGQRRESGRLEEGEY